MKILILGAGQVGASVAAILVKEHQNDITIVDTDGKALNQLQERLDIKTVRGHASHPNVLERAGAEETDILIAATSNDETNMVACELAHYLFKIPTKIARVRAGSYFEYDDIFGRESGKLAVDVAISPETLVMQQIKSVIDLPGATQIFNFANGRILLVGADAQSGGRLVGLPLCKLQQHMPGIDVRIAAIFRDDESISIDGDTIVQADDEVFFLCSRQNARLMMNELRPQDGQVKRIIIAGGGNIGLRLAEALEDYMRVKIIEHNPKTAENLAAHLTKAIVLAGDCADEDLLLEENIENTDVFCAVTNDDHANILSCMLAKRLGAQRVMSLINRSAYVDLVQSESVIDVTFSPQQVTIGAILTFIRRGDVVKVHSLREGAAEALEIIAHGDRQNSKVIGRKVEEIDWPTGVYLAALVRNKAVVICHHDTEIREDDHLILFLSDKQSIPEVEQLFQNQGDF